MECATPYDRDDRAAAAAGASRHPRRSRQAAGAGRRTRPPVPASAGLGRRDASVAAALVTLGGLLLVGTAHARVADERGGQVGERTLATERHAVPAPTGRQATSAQPAAPSSIRQLLVVVGAASLIVVLAAAASFLRLRARPRAAT